MGAGQKNHSALTETAAKPDSCTHIRLTVVGMAQEDLKQQRARRKSSRTGS